VILSRGMVWVMKVSKRDLAFLASAHTITRAVRCGRASPEGPSAPHPAGDSWNGGWRFSWPAPAHTRIRGIHPSLVGSISRICPHHLHIADALKGNNLTPFFFFPQISRVLGGKARGAGKFFSQNPPESAVATAWGSKQSGWPPAWAGDRELLRVWCSTPMIRLAPAHHRPMITARRLGPPRPTRPPWRLA